MQWTLKIGMVLELGEPKTSRQILVFVVVVLVCWRHRRRRESRDKLTARVGKHPPHCHSAFSEEACRVAAAYIPRSSDVFIVTAPKTGTTFLQMLCHCVRTQGLTDFQDIYQVSPWDQLAWDLGQDLGDEPVSQPRLFKSHLRLASINQGAKYICLVRRPEDVFRSWWRFLRDKDVPPLQTYKSISEFVFDKDYVAEGMRFGASLWEYYVEFYKCIDLPEVLVLCYEDLQESVAGHLDLISTFLSCAPLSHEERGRVLQLCSRDSMAAADHKFDESWTYKELRRLGRSPDGATSFRPATRVHLQQSHEGFNQSAKEFLEQQWKAVVGSVTGLQKHN